jgi:hypothetical protein
MKTAFEAYAAGEAIPVQQFIRNRKLVKYFNRETAAAMVCAARLLREAPLPAETPFYYETGVMEFENLGLDDIATGSVDAGGGFDQRRFVAEGAKAVPPLTQFKALYNMPLSFVAIEHGLTGDNAVIYASARGLLELALAAPGEGEILLGAGKTRADGGVECGFARVRRAELAAVACPAGEAIELLRAWHREAAGA